jgi:propanol-preferring alcohol dehydrogenase
MPAMTQTMRAAVVTNFDAPLELREAPVPQPAANEVLVKVASCGVCHTDLHASRGDWPVKPALPFIPGHEATGYVAALGPGVTNLKEGDRVGVPWLHSACGQCSYCLSGWETLCPYQTNTGYSIDGGFAEYLVAPAPFAARIPDKLGFDIAGDKLDLARALGAEITLDARRIDPADEVQRLVGGAHGALVTAVSPVAFTQAIGMLRRGGTVSLVGLPPGAFETPIFDVVLKRLTIRGSIVGTRAELAEALDFAARGKVRVTFETQPLEAINETFERLAHGDINGRVVLQL